MPKKNTRFQIVSAGTNNGEAEILIYGDIGQDWFGDGVDAKQFVEDLQALEVSKIRARINSFGGSVSEGLAIHNALLRHSAEVTTSIDGVAASVASLIAMAADKGKVEMSDNSLLMVHAPWSIAMGNSKDMRATADVLDTIANAMSSSYMRQTGMSKDEVMALLTDGEDHWYTAEEAKTAGFVDTITTGDAQAIAASGIKNSRFAKRAPDILGAGASNTQSHHVMNIKINVDDSELVDTIKAAQVAAKHHEEPAMSKEIENKATEKPAAEPKATPTKEEVLAANRQRVVDIRAAYAPFEARDGVRKIMDACIDDHTITAEVAREKLLAHLGKGAEPLGSDARIEPGMDESEKRINAAMDSLLVRAGINNMKGNGITPKPIDLQGNPFVGYTLMDMARASLRANGINPDGMDKRKIVATAFQTTSDFPNLLENTIHKMLQTAYMTTPDTWTRYCKIGEVGDFRAHKRYRMGSIGNLDSLNENGEFQNKNVPDASKESITAGTKGNIIAITRETIINDDLQALVDLATMLGRAGKRTIESDVYALLALNGGLGPAMNDGNPLFDASHNNIGTGAAISMAAIDADRVVMASQTDASGNEYLDLTPAKLLVPIGLGGTARSINNAQYDPDTANKLQKPNVVNGLFDDIIDTPRISGTRRYLFADPNVAPVIEVAFLDGQQDPYVETKDGWSVDGAEMKVRHDYAVGAIGYEGAVTNAGA